MARIKETFNSRAWFMIECDDPNCEQRFDDSQWYADEDDLLTDAKDEGWQILYKDEHPELERDMHYCPAHRLPECTTCTNIIVLLQCLFDRFGSVFPQCGLMVFPGVVIVSR